MDRLIHMKLSGFIGIQAKPQACVSHSSRLGHQNHTGAVNCFKTLWSKLKISCGIFLVHFYNMRSRFSLLAPRLVKNALCSPSAKNWHITFVKSSSAFIHKLPVVYNCQNIQKMKADIP